MRGITTFLAKKWGTSAGDDGNDFAASNTQATKNIWIQERAVLRLKDAGAGTNSSFGASRVQQTSRAIRCFDRIFWKDILSQEILQSVRRRKVGNRIQIIFPLRSPEMHRHSSNYSSNSFSVLSQGSTLLCRKVAELSYITPLFTFLSIRRRALWVKKVQSE